MALMEIPPKHQKDTLTGDELEALMLFMFKQGYNLGRLKEADLKEIALHFNAAIVDMYEQNGLTAPKRYKS